MVIKKSVCSILSLAGLIGSLSCASMAIPSSPAPENGPEKYAVLISGQTEERHALNMTLVYNFLLDNGYDKNNIQVLDAKGSDRLFCYPVDAAATVDNVRAAFESLESKLDKDDSLFVYVSDHGDRYHLPDGSFVSTISTNDGSRLDQKIFEGFVNDLNYGLGVFVFDQCYSGGFAEETGHGNNVAISSASADESAYSGGIHNSFTAYFIKAYIFSQLSDDNLDGNVSIAEAFEYADSNNPYTVQDMQQPVIQTELDADKIFFFDDK